MLPTAAESRLENLWAGTGRFLKPAGPLYRSITTDAMRTSGIQKKSSYLPTLALYSSMKSLVSFARGLFFIFFVPV